MELIRHDLAVPLTALQPIPSEDGIPSLRQVAEDYYDLYSSPLNNDLNIEFEPTVRGYGQSADAAYLRLVGKQLAMLRGSGKYQSFVPLTNTEDGDRLYRGRLRAVGSSALTVLGVDHTPDYEEIDPQSPNVSLVICNPFRERGLGRLLITRQLQAVNEDFSGRAWTVVRRQTNIPSQKMVTRAGFKPIAEGDYKGNPSIFYNYNQDSA